ncbi:hypothetical protein [Polaribacter pacificus]|nr:hypothetical protein [Polaribacter pacificus]
MNTKINPFRRFFSKTSVQKSSLTKQEITNENYNNLVANFKASLAV